MYIRNGSSADFKSCMFDSLKCDKNQGIESWEEQTLYLYIPCMFSFDFQDNLLEELGLPLLSLQMGGNGLKQYEGYADVRVAHNSQHYPWMEVNGCFVILLAQT